MTRRAPLVLPLLLCGSLSCGAGGPPWFIQGTARLDDCTEAPSVDLDGSRWSDAGEVEIGSTGCLDAQVGERFRVCSLAWEFTQTGNDVTILVDDEYTIRGRICGDVLRLEGGWWLPVAERDTGFCEYAEDSADEVGIQAEGNELTIDDRTMSGTLALQGSCSASYAITLSKASP